MLTQVELTVPLGLKWLNSKSVLCETHTHNLKIRTSTYVIEITPVKFITQITIV
jgi:hypothetical protein